MLMFNLLLRFLMESYIEIALCSIEQLHEVKINWISKIDKKCYEGWLNCKISRYNNVHCGSCDADGNNWIGFEEEEGDWKHGWKFK